jgi:serine/threonine protein kinase
VIKIYLPTDNRTMRLRAQRERIALEHLAELVCTPKLLVSNVIVESCHQSNKELWTVMKPIDGERLFDYVRYNKLDLRQALKITRQLLTVVKQIHARNVIHRDIQPKNILVRQQSNNDEIYFMLINFGSAWISNVQWTNSPENIDDELGNVFYRMPQFEQQQNENNDQLKQFQQSSTIDTTAICAILFWLITSHEPRESQDLYGRAPHKLNENSKIIEKKINEVTGKIKFLT